MFLAFLGPPTYVSINSTVNQQKLPFSDPTHQPLCWHNTWMVPKRFGSKFSFLCGQDKVGWKVANQKPILFIQKRQGFKRLYWWRASQISHVFNTITNFDKINFPINEIHWIVLNFHHHGADCWEHRKCKDFFFSDHIM